MDHDFWLRRLGSEQVHLASMHNCSIVLTPCRHCALNVKPAPAPRREVKTENIVQASAATIATKNVQSILVDDTRGPAPFSRP